MKTTARFLRELLQQLETGHPRHLNIQEDGSDNIFRKKPHRLVGAHGAAYNIHKARLPQQPGQSLLPAERKVTEFCAPATATRASIATIKIVIVFIEPPWKPRYSSSVVQDRSAGRRVETFR